jgi:hypothetical protein
MFQFPLQIVLLFAVSISQIFGGISCCCLGKGLFGDSPSASEVVVRDLESGSKSVSTPKPVGKCPKCSGRRAERSTAKDESSRTSQNQSKVCEDSQCRCVKLIVNAKTEVEPVSIHGNEKAWSSSVVVPMPLLVLANFELRKFEVPVRFGGRSWQTIACVWKN